MQAMIICGYPGIGKTTYCNSNPPFICKDSDSSNFSWIYDASGNKIERNPDFPNNYIEQIRKLMYKTDIIFVSTHKEDRDALYEARIPHVIIYPSDGAKDYYFNIYKARGSSKEFIEMQEENWDNFHKQLQEIDENDIVFIHKIYSFEDEVPHITSTAIEQIGERMYNAGIDVFTHFKLHHPTLVEYK